MADYYKGLSVFDAQNLTLWQHLERWLADSKRSHVKDTTFESYSAVIRCHVVPA